MSKNLEQYIQVSLLILMLVGVVLVLSLYRIPKTEKYRLTLKYPTIITDGADVGREILWTDFSLTSKKYSELFVNEEVLVKARLFDIDPMYFKERLLNRSLVVVFTGVEPDAAIALTYDDATKSFLGDGMVKFPMAGAFKMQLGYGPHDKTPRKLLGESNTEFQVLNSDTKYQAIMNDRVFVQSKIVFILTIILSWIALRDFIENFFK